MEKVIGPNIDPDVEYETDLTKIPVKAAEYWKLFRESARLRSKLNNLKVVYVEGLQLDKALDEQNQVDKIKVFVKAANDLISEEAEVERGRTVVLAQLINESVVDGFVENHPGQYYPNNGYITGFVKDGLFEIYGVRTDGNGNDLEKPKIRRDYSIEKERQERERRFDARMEAKGYKKPKLF